MPKFDVEIKLGNIPINSVSSNHLSDDAIHLHIDSGYKRPDYEVYFDTDDGVLKIELCRHEDSFSTSTITKITVSGFTGDWFAFDSPGKWGPEVALLRRNPEKIDLNLN